MYRFTAKTLNIVTNIVKQKHYFIFDHNNSRTLIKLPCTVIFTNNFSSATPKSSSPLGTFINKDVTTTTGTSSAELPEDEETKKQREASWRTMKLTLLFLGVSFTCLGSYLIFVLGGPEKDLNGRIIEDDLSHMYLWKQYLLRTYRELDRYRKLIKEPSRDKLLPDPLEFPYLQPKYTLVLELTDVLVHPDWTYNTGWRFKKRPGLDFFLESLHGVYEIVIYTAEQGMTVFPLIEAMDPKNIIAYKLVRDATHFTGGKHVKSLDKLNRDLTKVIAIDWDAGNVQFHPDNLLRLKRWDGTDDDTCLVDLSMFLKIIADNDVEDVREVLKYYSEYDDPIEAFKDKQKKLIEQLETQVQAKTVNKTMLKKALDSKLF